MSASNNNHRLVRVAIIGAGPAGFYTAGELLKSKDFKYEVDMYDRLPTPYGLVRGGVAPDHQKIKSVTRVYERIAMNSNFRYFGNVEFGTDIKLSDLKSYYHQIVFATGSQTGRKLDIPGADLVNSYPASSFVAWYNGHPDYRHLNFDLSQESAAVIGIGNVALDIARILCRTPEELHKTDIADYALVALRNASIKNVYLLGRRGPVQAAFTPPEIKEISDLGAIDIYTRQDEVSLDELSKADLDLHNDRAVQQNVEIIQALAARKPSGKSRRLHLRFLVSPVALIGDENGHIRRMKLVKNKLYRTEAGTLRPRPTDQYEEIPVDLAFHAIGYRGVPLEDIPFNHRWGTINNNKGRVVDENDVTLPGLYAVGWIKRGPSGVIGTNKPDAVETVKVMLADLEAGITLNPPYPDAIKIEKMVRNNQPRYVSFDDWLRLDKLEIERGEAENRPRKKFTVVEEMLSNLDI